MGFSEEEGVCSTADGRTVGWLMRGPEDGQVVGWLHGQPGSRRDVRVFSEDELTRHRIRFLAIDRGGYGQTDPAGMDRRDVAQDLLSVADHLHVDQLPVMAVSMGGIYALAAAVVAPHRVSKVVLVSAHVMPYDDAAVVALLSAAEQADVENLRRGPTPELEAEYAQMAAATVADPVGLLQELARGWSPREQSLAKSPWIEQVAESLRFGLATGHVGYFEDGLRTVQPLEFDLFDVGCPVRAVHGTIDDLEPYANLERAAAVLPDCAILALPGMGHYGPWLWPDSVLGLLAGH